MRLCLISDGPGPAPQTPASDYDIDTLRRWAVALGQHGHQIYWLLSTAHFQALQASAPVVPAATETLPAPCRYVVPVQPYEFAGLRLYCVDQQVWQHVDLHTRLFTFLCLLQRALSCDVWHAWGALAVTYLAVYTARCVAVPAVVSYDAQMQAARLPQPFLWRWVAQHVAAAVVPSTVARAQLLRHSALTPARTHVVEPGQPDAGRTLTGLYTRLCGADQP